MAGEIGDITISAGSPGHVGMFMGPDTIMHAQNTGGVHSDPLMAEKIGQGGSVSYEYFTSFAYRPPWNDLPEGTRTARKADLARIAARMNNRVPYGLYRAIRLFLGSTTFGSGAQERLKKYWERLNLIRGDANTKLLTKVTCVEAAVITYQLAFYEARTTPFFINLDAAHTMPHTLEKWLLANRWTRVAV